MLCPRQSEQGHTGASAVEHIRTCTYALVIGSTMRAVDTMKRRQDAPENAPGVERKVLLPPVDRVPLELLYGRFTLPG